MASQGTENADDESINPQILSWVDHARTEIKQNTPKSLQESLLGAVEIFISTDTRNLEQKTLDQQNLEGLIKNARTLNEAMAHYADRMKPLIPSAVLKDNLSYFWDNFSFDQLEKNALEKVMKDLVEKVETSEAEVKYKTEKRDEILEKAKTDLDRDLVDYFSEEERNIWYEKLEALDGDETKIKIWRKDVMKARNKKIKVIGQFSAKYKNKISSPSTRCRKDFEWLLGHCGGRNFYARKQHAVVRTIEENLLEAENIEAQAAEQFETLNKQYEAITGSSLDIPEVANDSQEPTNKTEQEKTVTESYESAESKIKVLETLRTEAKNSAKYWGEKANDRGHGSRGVGSTMSLLAAGAMEGYSLENYEEEIGKVGHLVPHNNKYAKTQGRKIPEIFYDIPTDAVNFNASMAASTASKLKAAQNLSEHGRAAASLFYNNFYKDKDPSMVTPSINEFIGSCNSMIKQLTVGKTLTAQAA